MHFQLVRLMPSSHKNQFAALRFGAACKENHHKRANNEESLQDVILPAGESIYCVNFVL